jgi:sec-independent protein translocase protein TatB/colicin import membrane protein
VFGISGFELLIIVAFVLIIFGPDKLPELAKTVGAAMRMFKGAQEDMERVIKAEMITGSDGKFGFGDVLSDSKPAANADQAASAPAEASIAAATAWAATAEDDDEEEDEE